MRVLIDQQYHLGHHYSYVRHLLPAVTALADDVVVAITAVGAQSKEFQTYLSEFTSVRFETVHAEAEPSLPMRDRIKVHKSLRQAVESIQPDYVLIPSGDAQATAMSLYRWTGRGHVPKSVPTEVGIHFGSGAAGGKTHIRDLMNAVNLGAAGLRRVHLVNQLFYEECINLPLIGRRFSTIPHPTPTPVKLSKHESRRRLGIPEDGRYIGLAASLDSRKAIGEFLAAFRAASSSPKDRVLLAGWMNNTHRATIDQHFADLLRDGRLILLSGFLDAHTYQAAISALDVVCTPYPGFSGLSSTLLEGVAAGRPVLANASGWSQAMVRRFRLGWTTDVLNHQAFTAAIRKGLAQFEDYRETEAIRRLLLFHTPENFSRTWTQGIKTLRGITDEGPYRWAWVQEPLAELR